MKRQLAVLISLFFIFSVANAALASSNGRRRASFSPERIEGVLTAIDNEHLTIRTSSSDRQVNLTSSTIVKVAGQKTTATALNVGDRVEVQASKASDGTLTAVTVEVDTDADVEGVVKQIAPASITITTKDGDQTFGITADTILLLHGVRTSTNAIKVGDKVEVHWVAGPANTRVARLINLHTDVTEVEGTVTAVSAGSITVQPHHGGATVTLAITNDTVIRFAGRQTSTSAIVVGAKVEVKAIRNADNTLTAIFIEAHNPNDLTEIKGTVTALDASSITVNDVKITVNADTIIRDDDKTASLSDVKVGDRVEVSAKSDGTTLTAVRVQIENEDERFTEVKGLVTSVNGSIVTVQTNSGSQTVMVTSSTTFRGGTVTDLKNGANVEITAKRNADGSLEALNVEIEDVSDDHGGDGGSHAQLVEVKGTIASVGTNSLTVDTRNGKVTVATDASTVVKNDNRNGTQSDLKAGQRVEIDAQRNADNTLLAKTIKIDD